MLAAGRGKRMRSSKAKVLHEIAGRPLIAHVLQTARELGPAQVHVVVGRDGGEVASRCADGSDLNWIEQTEQLGTGHATSQAMPHVDDSTTVMVVYGDVPLADGQTLARCADASADGDCIAVVTADAADPGGLGRVLHNDDGSVAAIVEDADASDAERRVTEINTGILAAPAASLKRLLAGLGNDNAQGEFYLTDIVAAAQSEGVPVMAIRAPSFEDFAGVNDRVQLAAAERRYQQRWRGSRSCGKA